MENVETLRQRVIDNSKVMIGRNNYSQSLRVYALKPYLDGNYYSDCSSFICACFKSAGYDVPWMNSYAIATSDLFNTMPFTSTGNHIDNPEVILKPADVIVWDGHVEMIHSIKDGIVYVQGHGNNTPHIDTLSNVEKYNGRCHYIKRLKELNVSTIMDNEDKEYQPSQLLYCVQVGAYQNKTNAINKKNALKNVGYDSYIYLDDGLCKVQCGAFRNKVYADNLSKELHDLGFNNYVTKKYY